MKLIRRVWIIVYKKVISIVLALTLLLSFNMQTNFMLTAGEILKSYGVVSGDKDGNLNENMNLTRAEMAVIIASLNGKSQEAKSFKLRTSFSDVPPNSWYAPYVAYAEAMKWTSGIGNGKYGPNLSVTNKEAAAFLLNILGKKYTYERALEIAKAEGISNGLSNEGYINRGNLFKAMLDTLSVIPEGKSQPLGVVLGYVKPVAVKAKVKNLEILTTKEFNVNFENPVSDITKLSVVVKKDNREISVNSSWNNTNTAVKLTSDTVLQLGMYDVVVKENGNDIYSGPLILDEKKVSRIEIISQDIQVISSVTSDLGVAQYKVFDQYGEDITKDIKASSLLCYAGQFQASVADGILSIKPMSGNPSLFVKESQEITIVDPKTSTEVRKTLPLRQVVSSLNDFTVNSSGITIQNASTTPVYIGFKAVDIFGNITENYDLISAGLLDINFTGAEDRTTDLVVGANSAGIKVEIVRSSEDQKKAQIKVTPGNAILTEDVYINLIASIKSGKTTTIQIKVLK